MKREHSSELTTVLMYVQIEKILSKLSWGFGGRSAPEVEKIFLFLR